MIDFDAPHKVPLLKVMAAPDPPFIPRHHAKRWHDRMEAARKGKGAQGSSRPRLKGLEEFPADEAPKNPHMLSGSLLPAVALIFFAAGVGWMLG